MKFTKEFAIVIFLAVLTALIFVSAYIFMIILMGDSSFSLTIVNGVDSSFLDQTTYAANMREFQDGHPIITDAFIYEHKNGLNVLSPLLMYFILGFMTYITRSVSDTIFIGSFIFPLILFLLVYFLVYKATRNLYASIASPIFMLLGYMFILIPPYNLSNIFSFIERHFDASAPLNYFSRLPYIQLSFIFFLLSVIFLYITLEKRNKLYAIMTGILAGILFYTYLYHWMAFFIGLIFLILIFTKRDKTFLKFFIIILIIAAIVSIPYWSVFFNFTSDKTYYENISEKLGVETGRFDNDIFKTIKYFAVLIVFIFLTKKKDNYFYIISSFYMAGIIGLNLMTLLGFNFHFLHFESTLLIPLSAMIVIHLIWQTSITNYSGIFSIILRKVGIFYKYILIFIIIFFLLIGLSAQYTYAKNTYRYYSIEKNFKESYDWLNNNTETDDVVLTLSTEQNFLIPVFTHNNIFIPNGAISTATTIEATERFYISNKLFVVDPSYIGEIIDGINSAEYSKNMTTKGYDKTKFEKVITMMYLYHRRFYDSRLKRFVMPKEDILLGYINYTNDTEKLLSRYRIDYIFVGPYEKSIGNITFSNMSKLIWTNGAVDIYKVK